MADSLSDFTASPITITFGDKVWTCSPLTIADISDIAGMVVGDAMSMYLERTRAIMGVILPDSARAETMAAIATKLLAPWEVLDSAAGQMYLLWRSVSKTDKSMTLARFKAEFPPQYMLELKQIVNQISGLRIRPEATDGPLGSPATTTTPTSTIASDSI